MATLQGPDGGLGPDRARIVAQCTELARNRSELAPRLSRAVRLYAQAESLIERGRAGEATEPLHEIVRDLFETDADELVAGCCFYFGCIAFAGGDADVGVSMIETTLSRTRDPMLALVAYNRLALHALSTNDGGGVRKLAEATDRVADVLPASPQRDYLVAAARYNEAESWFREGESSKVVEPAEAALKAFEKLSLPAQAAKTQGLIGGALLRLEKFDDGMRRVNASMRFFREKGVEAELGFLHQARGFAWAKQGNKNAAVKDLKEAARLYKGRGEVEAMGLVSTLALLAELESE